MTPSADLDINRRLFGDELRELRLDVERRALVVQTRGRDFGNQSLTGKRKNERPHYPEQAERLRREVARVCKFLGMTLVIANKSAKESLAPHLEQVAETAHFGALRGLNAFEDHGAGAVVGREQPEDQPTSKAMPAPITPWTPEPLILGVEGYAEEVRGHRMADGTAVPVTVQVHPDPRVQKFLEQIREREGEQAVDRMRTVWAERQKRILVLSNVVYDLDVGYCPTWESLIKMVQRFESASGVPVLIMSRRGLVQSAPAVWTQIRRERIWKSCRVWATCRHGMGRPRRTWGPAQIVSIICCQPPLLPAESPWSTNLRPAAISSSHGFKPAFRTNARL